MENLNQRRMVFISHASEDKEDIARPLANALISSAIDVWLDESEIKWGDSLFNKINDGISKSLVGVVIISPTFLKKYWTKSELGALFSLFVTRHVIFLPLLHKISRDEVISDYPLLSDIAFESSDTPLSSLVKQIQDRILNMGSLKTELLKNESPRPMEFVEIDDSPFSTKDSDSVIIADNEDTKLDLKSLSSNKEFHSLLDVFKGEVESIMNKIQTSTNDVYVESQWKRLEILSINSRLWKSDEIWNLIEHELSNFAHSKNLSRSIVILRKMLINCNMDSKCDVSTLITTHNFVSILETIFFSDVPVDIKIIIRDIFIIIFNAETRFQLYWRYWKSIVPIEDEKTYLDKYSVIVTDFKNISTELKHRIDTELGNLYDDPRPVIQSRAHNLYDYLFC